MGVGRLNGAAGYAFLFVLADSRRRDGTGDRIRVRIWKSADGSVVYDSQMDDPWVEAPGLSIRGNLSVHQTGRP
jgi:hypothetical protein